MEHTKQVEILKALMQQLDEGKNIDAGVQYRHQTKAYVCTCLLYTSPSPRDAHESRMPSSA